MGSTTRAATTAATRATAATSKTRKGDFGEVPRETPRDRNGSYEPKIVSQGQTRLTGFDDKIISMYARGMRTRQIQGHLEEIYKVEVSPTLISNVTEEVMEEVKSWQNRPLYTASYISAHKRRRLSLWRAHAANSHSTVSMTRSNWGK